MEVTHTAVTDWPVTETIRTSKGEGGRLLATHTAAIWLYMGWKFCSSTKAADMATLQKLLQKLIQNMLWQNRLCQNEQVDSLVIGQQVLTSEVHH